MSKAHNDQGEPSETADDHEDAQDGGINKTVATVVVVAAGAAIFEAALLPGIAIGVAAMAAPKYMPRLAGAMGPLFKSAVRGTYKFAQKSREMLAEAQEQVNDIVAEVDAENDSQFKSSGPASNSRPAAQVG
jgi:hypothetical protein